MEEIKQLKSGRKSPLAFLSDASLRGEKDRVAAMVRLKHLARRGMTCRVTEELLKRKVEFEEWADSELTAQLVRHPTYWWTSHVRGTGKEVTGKLVGETEDFGRYYDVGHPDIPPGVNREPEEYITIDENGDEKEKFGIWVEAIERLQSPSKNRVFNGHWPGAVRRSGEKHSYNATLRMMYWRVGTSLLKARDIDWDKAALLLSKEEELALKMLHPRKSKAAPAPKTRTLDDVAKELAISREGARDLEFSALLRVITGSFARFYLEYKLHVVDRSRGEGTLIVPTPKERYCLKCNKEVVKKATKFCPECNEPLSQKKEPHGYLYEGHLHRMAQRRMQQLFGDLLIIVWRKSLGLPVPEPYPIAILGHSGIIRPEDMLDRLCGVKGCEVCEWIENGRVGNLDYQKMAQASQQRAARATEKTR